MSESQSKEKKVEYLELVYDLIFVYIIGRNNSLLQQTENGFSVKGGQQYRASEIRVEGDYSNAAFLDALLGTGGEVRGASVSGDAEKGYL